MSPKRQKSSLQATVNKNCNYNWEMYEEVKTESNKAYYK